MKKYLKVIIGILFTIELYGCASPAPKMNLSVPIETKVIQKEDKALVYFIRPELLGFKVHAAIYDGDTFVGFVPYKQKLPYEAEPGEHRFMVVSEAVDFMKADLLAGKTYYIQVMPRMGMWRARFSLAPITKDQLGTEKVKKWISEARLIKNNDLAYKWADDNHDSVLTKKSAYLKKWLEKDENDRPFLKPSDGE